MIVRFQTKKSLPKGTQALGIILFTDKGFRPSFLPAGAGKSMQKIIPKQFKPEADECYALPVLRGSPDWIFFIGLGAKKELTSHTLIRALQTLFRQAQEKGVLSLAFGLPGALLDQFDAETLGTLIAESAEIATYRYTRYKKKKPKRTLKTITIYNADAGTLTGLKKGARKGAYIGQSVNAVREYGNAPANEITPDVLARLAKETAQITHQKVTILNEAQMKKQNMGGIVGVSAGSKHEARFIIIEHFKGKKNEKPIVLVGKGITFDSGGISIKPSRAMDEMKFDMAGGGAVIGTMRAIGLLKLPLNVVGLVPATENVPGGSAYKPGDILTFADGTTVEVLNTDAEGRLIIADALLYARKYKPRTLIDVATLTGAIVVALGDFATGLFSNNEELYAALYEASLTTGEYMWRMPLPHEYTKRVKGTVADLRNVSSKSGGGSITAAKFLEHFIQEKMPWAHLDIAGTAWITADTPHQAVGATGAAVKTLVEYCVKQTRI